MAKKDTEVSTKKILPPAPENKRIIIVQQGWVFVGNVTESEDGRTLLVDDAHVIRVWGTKHGLGEIALNGPTSETVLEFCGRLQLERVAVLGRIKCVV